MARPRNRFGLGIEVFRENDPWHFRDFFFAMVTLFRMATLEDWTNVFYVNFYGCDKFTDTGLYILPNATCAIVQDCDKYLAAPGDFSDPLVTPAACLVDPAGARVAARVARCCVAERQLFIWRCRRPVGRVTLARAADEEDLCCPDVFAGALHAPVDILACLIVAGPLLLVLLWCSVCCGYLL